MRRVLLPGYMWVLIPVVCLVSAAPLGADPYRLAASGQRIVAMSGDTIVVTRGGAGIGTPAEAYVYVRPAGGWADMPPTAVLRPSYVDPQGGGFGSAVAIDGDTIVIGASSDGSYFRGAAYVYVKPAGGWANATENARLLRANGGLYDHFGASVGVSGATIVVGAWGAASTGALCVYERPSTGWAGTLTEDATLQSSSATNSGSMGRCVTMQGDTIVAGNWYAARAYVFEKSAARWADMTQTATLAMSDGTHGSAVAIDGDTIVVGSYKSDRFNGAAYVFSKTTSNWASMYETAKFTPPSGWNQTFGSSVAVLGDTIIVGAPYARSPGAAYVFEKPAGGWVDTTPCSTCKLSDPDGLSLTAFGASIAMSGSTVVIATAYPTNKVLVYTTLLNQEPVPVATFLPRVILGESVEFDGSGSYDTDGTIQAHEWDFGDGATGQGEVVTHAYATEGSYTVALRVRDDDGAWVSTPGLPITVITIGTAIDDLAGMVTSYHLPSPVERTLLNLLGDASSLVEKQNYTAASDKLEALIKVVERKRGDDLSGSEADALVTLTRRVLSVL